MEKSEHIIRKGKRASAWLQFEMRRMKDPMKWGSIYREMDLRKYETHQFPISVAYDAINWYSSHLPTEDRNFNGRQISKMSIHVMQGIMVDCIYNTLPEPGYTKNPYEYMFRLDRLKDMYKYGEGLTHFENACKAVHTLDNLVGIESNPHLFTPEFIGLCTIMLSSKRFNQLDLLPILVDHFYHWNEDKVRIDKMAKEIFQKAIKQKY